MRSLTLSGVSKNVLLATKMHRPMVHWAFYNESGLELRNPRMTQANQGVFAYPPETVYSFRGDMQKPPMAEFWLVFSQVLGKHFRS